jgi:CDP-diacylglycerol pyrophosphatase
MRPHPRRADSSMGRMMNMRNVLMALAIGWSAMMAAVADTEQANTYPWPGPAWTVQPKRNGLWGVVQQCVAAARGARPPGGSQAGPCEKVDLQNGYVILKDNSADKPYGFLLLPTASVTGIEDPHLWVLAGPNYWKLAYENRLYVARTLKRQVPATQIGFAANSIYGRSQDQLHIHIGCVQPAVAKLLSSHMNELSDRFWTWLPRMLGQEYQYRALLIDDAALAKTDPFRVLANDVYPNGAMVRHTMFMVAVTLPNGQPGFAILDNQAGGDVRHGHMAADSDWGSAEDLLDYKCGAFAASREQ